MIRSITLLMMACIGLLLGAEAQTIHSFTSEEASNPASNLIDGNTGSRWAADGMPQNVVIDYGESKVFTETRVRTFSNRAYQYRIDISATPTFSGSPVVDRLSNTSSAQPITDTFSGVTGRYLRITVEGASGYSGTWVSLYELEVEATTAGGGGSTGRLEAEDATYSGGVLSSNSSASGGEFVDGNAGFNISWTYSASSSGNHDLDFSVAAPSGTRTMGVFVNNSPVGTISTSAPRYSWEIQSVTANLNSGSNTIELRDTEGASEPDVDYLEVTSGGGGGGDTQAPSVPTGLASSNVGETSFDLSWNASTDNVGVTGYDVYRDGNLETSVSGTSTTISGLTAGTTYAMTVSAKDAAGNNSAQSGALNVTTSSSGGGSNDVSINFGPSSSGSPSGYEVDGGSVYGARGNGFSYGWSADHTGRSRDRGGSTELRYRTLNHLDGDTWELGLANGNYQLVIGCGDASYTDQVNTLNVEGVTVTDPDGQDNFDEYNVNVTVNDGRLSISAASGSSNPKICFIEITAGGSGGDTQAPSVPSGLSSSNIGQTSFDLSWNASTDNVGVTGYDVYRDGNLAASVSGTIATISGLSGGTTYAMTVSARDAVGNNSAQSSALNVTTTPGGGGGNPVYNRVRKLGTNMNYTYSWDVQDGSTGNGSTKFKQANVDFANTSNPWSDAFLDRMKIYQVIRFMNWTGGGNYFPDRGPEPPVTNWGDVPRKGDPLQGANTSGRVMYTQPDGRVTFGIAYEWMIDLCNRNQSDFWLNIPHACIDPDDFPNGDDFNNEYVHKLAILIKHGVDMRNVNLKSQVGGKNNLNQLASKSKQWFLDRGGVVGGDPLDSSLKIYLEYSNELWLHGQNSYAVSKATQLGLPSSKWSNYGAWANIRVWRAFEDVFGTNSGRLVKLGGHTYVDESQIRGTFTQVYNNSSRNPWNIQMDAWNHSSYINPGHKAPGFDKYCPAGKTDSFIKSTWVDELEWKVANWQSFIRSIIDDYGVTKMYSYEGGQHYDCGAGNFARRAISHDIMMLWADIYTDPVNGHDLVCHFTHEGEWTSDNHSGISSWGANESSLQPLSQAHKYRGLKDWVDGNTIPSARFSGTEPTADFQDFEAPDGFSVYPNPSDGNLLNVSMGVDNYQLTIRSVSGAVIYSTLVNSHRTTLNPTDMGLESGLYLMTATYGEESKTFKLVIK
ncbi:MAG: fibronectin type III domain-containing protein [Cyclobacteriaceae bacterium]|nr:fibronectin type III domain-containing protein [Cyclobacteriaceae bacterium HetDA_MAG_MS6]